MVFAHGAKLGEHLLLLRARVRAAGGARAHVEENLGGGGGGVESLGELSDGRAAEGDGGLGRLRRARSWVAAREARGGGRAGGGRGGGGGEARHAAGRHVAELKHAFLRAGVHGRGTARCEAGGGAASARRIRVGIRAKDARAMRRR